EDDLSLRWTARRSQDGPGAGLRRGVRSRYEAERRRELHLLSDTRALGQDARAATDGAWNPGCHRTAHGREAGRDVVKAILRLRLSAHDAHYGGGLVDGARVLGLFGDVATELLIRRDGDEGLFR